MRSLGSQTALIRGGLTFDCLGRNVVSRLPCVRMIDPRRRLASFVLLLLASPFVASPAPTVSAAEANWPQWRGPRQQGIAPAGSPPLTWSETENIKWKVKLPGSGTSTPIIWDNQIFIQTAIPTGQQGEAAESSPRGRGFGGNEPTEIHQFVLLCLDRQTGQTLWQRIAREELPHEGHHLDHGFASFSPVTDGTCVIAYFGSRGLYCYDMQGELQWEVDLGNQQTRRSFGEGSSPALFGNTVVVNWDHEGEDDFTVAFDKRTGQELWRQARQEPTTWATPLIVEHQGQVQVVTAGTEKIRSYDLATGELLWQGPGLTFNVIPTPVAAAGVVYLTSGFRGSVLHAVRLDAMGDVTDSGAIVWSHERNTPYVPSPLLYNNRLYFFSGNNAILSCLEATSGKLLYGPQRLQKLQGVYASPVGVAGRVYIIGRNGAALVIKDADQFEVLAENELDDRIDASPAVVGDELFLRGHEYLYCISAEK